MKLKTKQKKYLFVIDNLSTGGAQRQMIYLVQGLTQKGYKIEIFCYQPGDFLAKPLVDAGIPIHWYIKKNRYSFDVIMALISLISKGNYDFVLSFLTTPNFYALLSTQILRLKKIPVIVSERFCDLPEGVPFIERFVRQFYRFTSHVVTNSQHQRINFQTKYPWLKNRISTIDNGYDLNVFLPTTNEPNNIPLKILAIASVSPYKNGLCLIEALNILKRKYGILPSVDWIGQLVMMGFRLEYLNKMKTAIEKYGLEGQWRWLNQRSDIVYQLQQHDVLVHPSYGEGLPNVVCEAMACARPIILSNTLDHSRLIEHGTNGFLFNHEDPEDLAEKIKIFTTLSLDERKQMGLNNRKFAEAHLSQKRLVDEYEKIILSILGVKNENF